VKQYAYIYIVIPTEVTVYEDSIAELLCGEETLSGFYNDNIDCSIRHGRYIYVYDGFEDGASAADPPTLKFSVPQMQNPRSTRPTSSFEIYFYDESTDYPIYYLTEGITVTMTSAPSMESISLTRTNEMNSGISNYTFSIVTTASTSDTLSITLPPNSIFFLANSSCDSVVCTFSSNTSLSVPISSYRQLEA